MDVFFIYGLVDSGEPDVVRYVGQTKSLANRFKVHHAEIHAYHGSAGAWKWSVLFFGRCFEMRLLEVVYGSRAEARVREKFHIDYHEHLHGRLMNGQEFTARQKAAGVPPIVVRHQLGMILKLRTLLKENLTKTRLEWIKDVAGFIDHTETAITSLMMTKADSFTNRLKDLRAEIIRKARIARRELLDKLAAEMIYGS